MIEIHEDVTHNDLRFKIYPTHNCVTVATDYSGEHDVDLYEEDLLYMLRKLRSKTINEENP